MDIYEDDIYLPGDEAEDTISYLPEDEIDETQPVGEEAQAVPVAEPQKSDGPGTRIIYQAPEQTGKRKFTGFREVGEEAKKSVSDHKGGYAFEEEMRKNNAVPSRRPQQKMQPSKPQVSLEEEKKRRYEESLRRAAYEKELQRKRKSEKLFVDSDMEDVDDGYAKPPRSTGDKVRIAVMVVAIIAMAAALGVLVKQYIQQKQGADWQNEVTGLLIDVNEESTTKKPKKDKQQSETESTTERVLTIEEQWQQLYSDYPDVTFPQGLSLKYAKLYAVNQDFVGYISIDEFGVGLPVVQSQKDKAGENYYLRKNFYKQYSVYGCPFVPKDNNMEYFDRNTIIFGHNNNSNIAFAPINKYKTLDGYKRAPVIHFDTIYGNHTWKIIAAFIINTNAGDDNGYIFNYTFTKMQSDEEFMNYIRFVKERSLYDTGVDILPTDKILTLSTCSHDFDNARFVVIARLVRPGETDDVNTSIAVTNERPRYPQAYYEKKKKKNPYKDAERWFYSGN